MSRTLSYLAALAIIIASGIVPGLWAGRWSAQSVLADRVAALGRVPRTIGDWESRDLTLDRETLEMGEIDGYLLRRYQDRRQGDAVTVLIVCGRPGPIAVHTPEICYGGSGYEPVTAKVPLPIGCDGTAPPADVFWALDLGKPGPALPEHLRILYAWNAEGAWKIADNPRLDFADTPALYKMYIVRESAAPGDPLADDPGVRFARQALSEIGKALFATP